MRQVGRGGGGEQEEEEEVRGSEGQGGVVLLDAALLRHHADQRLHSSAQVVSHVEQTADTRAWGRGTESGGERERETEAQNEAWGETKC